MVNLIEFQYDTYTDKKTGENISIKAFVWENKNHVSVQVITYGAIITSVKVPDKNGNIADIVMGFKDLKGFQEPNNPYFGATIGRVANRIGSGKFKLLDQTIQVSKNLANKHQLHGGFVGFDKVVWEHFIEGNKVVMSYHSADLEEGYPGDLVVFAIFELTETNEFRIEYKATSTKPTYVNMTSHSYFNLAGHSSGPIHLYKHVICINADRITDVDNDSVPTGKLLPVADTVFDLRVPKVLGEIINQVPNSPGFDHNFCITREPEEGIVFNARVYHPDSGRVLEIYSNQAGIQFYTANFLPEHDENGLSGKEGEYFKHGSFCLETQNWPDAPNHENFPKAVLLPGEMYYHHVSYKFSVKK